MSPGRAKARQARPRSVSEILSRLLGVFQPKDRVLITVEADPDSLASALAFKRLLWRRVANITISNINEIKRLDNVAMVRLLKIPLVRASKIKPEEFSKFVLVDGQPNHHEAFNGIRFDAIIDHHPVTTDVSAPFVDIRPQYGATATMMTEYLRAAKVRPSTGLATALIYAIRVDTRNFEAGAMEEDVKAFRYLFPLANMNLLRKIEISDMALKDLKYFQLALQNKRVMKGKIFSHLGQVNSPDILVLIADFFMRCQEVTWAVVSGVHQRNLVVIIRNDGFRKNAGKMAIRCFGPLGMAGGHKAMARAEIPLDKLEDRLLKGNGDNLGRLVIRQFNKGDRSGGRNK